MEQLCNTLLKKISAMMVGRTHELDFELLMLAISSFIGVKIVGNVSLAGF